VWSVSVTEFTEIALLAHCLLSSNRKHNIRRNAILLYIIHRGFTNFPKT